MLSDNIKVSFKTNNWMGMDRRVLVRMNVLGIDLAIDQVDAVLTNANNIFEREKAWLTSFFQLDSPSELTRGVLTRYAEADAVMARISVGTNHEDIYDRLIGTLVSAKRCYSNAEYLACIELCALHGEMLANYLCITERGHLEKVFSSLPQKNQDFINADKGEEIYFSDKLNQTLRLRWLLKAGVISPDDRKQFLYAHGLRIKYFHHWSPKRGNERRDAMNALSKISPVTAKFLEILGLKPRTYNTANLDRVKRYMRIVSDEYQECNYIPEKMQPLCDFFHKLRRFIFKK